MKKHEDMTVSLNPSVLLRFFIIHMGYSDLIQSVMLSCFIIFLLFVSFYYLYLFIIYYLIILLFIIYIELLLYI